MDVMDLHRVNLAAARLSLSAAAKTLPRVHRYIRHALRALDGTGAPIVEQIERALSDVENAMLWIGIALGRLESELEEKNP